MVHQVKLAAAVSLVLLAALQPSTALQGVLSCGAFSSVVSTDPMDDTTGAVYDTCDDAKAAAEHSVKNKLVAITGIECDECAPPDCHSGIYYWDDSQLNSGCVYDPSSGKFWGYCNWAGGDCQVYCTLCP